MPGIRQPPEARRAGGRGSSLKVSRKNQCCQQLDLRLPASKIEREYIPVVSGFPVCARFDMEILENEYTM